MCGDKADRAELSLEVLGEQQCERSAGTHRSSALQPPVNAVTELVVVSPSAVSFLPFFICP